MKNSDRRGKKVQNWRSVLRRIWGAFCFEDQQLGYIKVPDLLENLEMAWRDWQYAKGYFNSVADPDLIDHAIFWMGASEKKYMYLLKQAREQGINVEPYSFTNRVG